jgi:hypothetical protein
MSNAIPDTCEICYGCGEVELLDRRTVSCPECVGRELTGRIAAAEAERDALALEVTHWKQEAESYKPAWDQMKAELATARQTIHELQCELRQERGLKALLANGMPPTGNDDFDKVLATHPVAAMIQRGWLPGVTGFDDLPALESAICHFWGVKTIAECVNPPLIAARKDAKPICGGCGKCLDCLRIERSNAKP